MFRRPGAVAALLSVAAALQGATLARSPYLQNLGPQRVTIIWTTLERGEGAVEFFAEGGEALRARAAVEEFAASLTGLKAGYFQYRADLAGLEPGEQYGYRVLVDGDVLAGGDGFRFRTPAPGNAIRFLVFGDSGAGTPAQAALGALMAREAADFVLHTGDLAYPHGTFTDFHDRVFPVYAEWMRRRCFFPVPGNHEYDTNDAAPYLAAHAVPQDGVPERDRGRYYSFDWGNAHFVALDTNRPLCEAAAGTGAMLEWLEEDLRRTRRYWRIALLHNPPYPSGARANDAAGALARQHIVPILERHGVQLALGGHEHNYQRTHPLRGGAVAAEGTGTVYITTGGGGAHLYDVGTRPELAFGASAHHYLRVEVAGNQLAVVAVGLDGQEIERVRLVPAPRVGAGAVLNPAAWTPKVAPGGLISVFGTSLGTEESFAAALPLPGELCGARLSINGRRLPLLYASPTQINAQLPFDAAGQVSLRISTGNGATEVPVAVSETAPAIFSPGVTHTDGRLAGPDDPAAPGAWLSVWMTGLGRVEGGAGTGEAAPAGQLLRAAAPVLVEFGGRTLIPAFAGLAPGAVGLFQVVFQAPADMPEGTHTLRVTAGGAASNETAVPVRR